MQGIKKGDTVKVIAGKDKGQQGQVLDVLTKDNRVVVERVNIVKKAQRRQQVGRNQVGGIIEFEAPIDRSNVMLICTKCAEATRVNFRFNEEGQKVRVCKKCGQDID
ncbi:MAG TPA: 50S ribosomal protein L24 [Aggregatilineales bacterium]|nr:50S ribosomal protein L24 [Anaerolineales bacterium]HRE48400.1 50S ribosomal protein L24 [Aggregatilineales bacterium]